MAFQQQRGRSQQQGTMEPPNPMQPTQSISMQHGQLIPSGTYGTAAVSQMYPSSIPSISTKQHQQSLGLQQRMMEPPTQTAQSMLMRQGQHMPAHPSAAAEQSQARRPLQPGFRLDVDPQPEILDDDEIIKWQSAGLSARTFGLSEALSGRRTSTIQSPGRYHPYKQEIPSNRHQAGPSVQASEREVLPDFRGLNGEPWQSNLLGSSGIRHLRLERADYDSFLATWMPEEILPFHLNRKPYKVEVYCEGLYLFSTIITVPQYLLSHPHPTKKYYVLVSVKGHVKVKSNEISLCKDLGRVYCDFKKPFRAGYQVYEGYVEGAFSILEKIAVKITMVLDQKKLNREIELMLKLSHPNIVSYRLSGRVGDIENQIYIAMGLCRPDTLYEIVKSPNWLCDIRPKEILRQIMHGLSHIHQNDILHRDLKPQNILCSLDGKTMKISDFGLGKQTQPGMSKASKSVREVGTDGWGSPEHYEEGAEMSDKSDIYSSGLVFSFVLSGGKHVFGKEHHWKSAIIDNHPIDLSFLDSEIAKDVIRKMLSREPHQRPSARDVLKHPYFWESKDRIRFLHLMSNFLSSRKSRICQKVVQELEQNKAIVDAKGNCSSWVAKLKREKGVVLNYSIVLLKAEGRIWPWTRYQHNSNCDLIRFIRNITEHYTQEKGLREVFYNSDNIWTFFEKIFPMLLPIVYNQLLGRWPELGKCEDFPHEAREFFPQVSGGWCWWWKDAVSENVQVPSTSAHH